MERILKQKSDRIRKLEEELEEKTSHIDDLNQKLHENKKLLSKLDDLQSEILKTYYSYDDETYRKAIASLYDTVKTDYDSDDINQWRRSVE